MNSRRRFLVGAASLLVAPAIVQASSIAPISIPRIDVVNFYNHLYAESGGHGRWFLKCLDGFHQLDVGNWLVNKPMRGHIGLVNAKFHIIGSAAEL